jgi:Na+/H+-dicarboxylate symporter
MLAPLFLAIGLPLEGIGILIAVDAITDLFATVTNATGDLAATTLVARFSSSTQGLAGRNSNRGGQGAVDLSHPTIPTESNT